ncbi:MAG: phosphate signaling complex protein PhoU [Planctomycetes bacterium]|nr:phosphate signaling complex protein PhoU [Planctomycetota bacterium]MCB9869199.1 phosphate signaling complex protein PhoU [Planctomycetota bacterium]
MGKHLRRDLDLLKKDILTMGALVESATNKAIAAFTRRSEDLAREVLICDDEIDDKENEVEDLCLKILALHQPVAFDLRFVVMVLKFNHDLERMGDIATHIAEQTLVLLNKPSLAVQFPIAEMGEAVRAMVRDCLDALVRSDANLARTVCAADDRVDAMHRKMFDAVELQVKEGNAEFDHAVRMLSMSRYLERIADHATNIAEDIVFMVDGEVIRHGT